MPEAVKNGYRLGEHMLGGAFILFRMCFEEIVRLYPYDLMTRNEVYRISIGDDVIFSLLAFASNFRIEDFGRPSDPLAVAQDYLPISKEEIVKQRKQLN